MNMKKIGLSLLATALLAACATQEPVKPVDQSAQAAQAAEAAKAAQAAAAAKAAKDAAAAKAAAEAKMHNAAITPVAPVVATPGAYSPLTDANNVLSQRAVYFDFDKYNVKEDATELVEAHANYLTMTSGAKIALQGHADERGTAEYNLALGQKRADAVKKVMVTAYGVEDKQVQTISYGKEKPAVQGHDEAAWAKNRRVEMAYPGEAKFPKK